MLRRLLLRWFAPLLFGLAVCGPAVQAQVDTKIPRAADQDRGSSEEESSGRTPALQYLVAALLALSVLVVVCMPSRKN